MHRVVLDTSVLVSAFITPRGTAAEVVGAAERRAFRAFLSAEILAETTAALLDARKRLQARYGFDAADVDAYCARLTASAEMVTELPTLRVVPGDPKDDMVVATAVAARADFLVTGDRRHLLPLGTHGDVRIVTPREFLGLLAK